MDVNALAVSRLICTNSSTEMVEVCFDFCPWIRHALQFHMHLSYANGNGDRAEWIRQCSRPWRGLLTCSSIPTWMHCALEKMSSQDDHTPSTGYVTEINSTLKWKWVAATEYIHCNAQNSWNILTAICWAIATADWSANRELPLSAQRSEVLHFGQRDNKNNLLGNHLGDPQ